MFVKNQPQMNTNKIIKHISKIKSFNLRQPLKILTLTTILFIIPTTNLNAMPTVSEVLLSPLKIITKPIQWLRYGWENKVDEYKVQITYNLEFDGKPLIITKAINCEIFEGSFRPDNDGIRRPTRRVSATVDQITHKISETGEILILPVPGYCVVDKSHKEEKITDKNGKTKLEITPIANKTKSFGKFTNDVIMSLAIAKFDSKNHLERIERVLSPKYYDSENARIKLISYEAKAEDDNNPIDKQIPIATPEIDNRFSWIDGIYKREKKTYYQSDDKGVYSAFGAFIYPKEIWSKIPIVNDFITKAIKFYPDQETICITRDDKNFTKEEINKSLNETYRYLADIQSFYNIKRYFGSRGINGGVEASILAKTIAESYGLMVTTKGKTLAEMMWIPKLGKEKEFAEIYKKSNYRDYYHPFTYNHQEKLWEVDESGKGLLLIEKVSDGKNFNNKDSGEFRTFGRFKIKEGTYGDKVSDTILYNNITKELSLITTGHQFYLK